MLEVGADGDFGYYLKQVSGPVLVSFNEAQAFYPASSIKVLEHLHAMRAVNAGLSLDIGVTVYPGKDETCEDVHPDDHLDVEQQLQLVLAQMMQPSDNPSTNALQEYFGAGNAGAGRTFMNATAHSIVGMSDLTQLVHKFGCGGPSNDPANTLTLADLGSLYERVAIGELLSPDARDTFYALMLNESNAFPSALSAVIAQEADTLGVANLVRDFTGHIKLAYKGGNIASSRLSLGGWIELPLKPTPPSQAHRIGYVYGLFIDHASTADKTGGAQLSIRGLMAELLRDEIREALESW